MHEKPTTRQLEKVLQSTDSKKALLNYLAAPEHVSPYHSFIEYFKSLPKTAGIVPADLYKLANLDRSYCYKIWDGTKRPGRDKILLICIAAGLDNTEVRRALEAGGEAILYSRNTRDAALIHAIEQGYTVEEVNALLAELGMPVLE